MRPIILIALAVHVIVQGLLLANMPWVGTGTGWANAPVDDFTISLDFDSRERDISRDIDWKIFKQSLQGEYWEELRGGK
jgi:hypothetical protein